MSELLEWEAIGTYESRAKVIGGWLVKVETGVTHITFDGGMQEGWDWRTSLAFVPDPKHEWGKS